MDRRMFNWVISVLLTIAFLLVFVTGLLKLPGLLGGLGVSRGSLPLGYISTVHDFSGVAMGVLALVHVFVYRKRLFRRVK